VVSKSFDKWKVGFECGLCGGYEWRHQRLSLSKSGRQQSLQTAIEVLVPINSPHGQTINERNMGEILVSVWDDKVRRCQPKLQDSGLQSKTTVGT
jgi:hypothetical protein